MVEKICNWLMTRVRAKMPEVEEERAEVIRYGFELIIGEVPKLILMFVIALLLGKFELFIISVAIICPYRTFSGGIHLKTHVGCFISTNLLYLGNVYISEFIKFESFASRLIFSCLVFVFAAIMIIVNVPADTDTVPILIKKDRNKKKIESFICVVFLIVLQFIIKNETIGNMCMIGVLLQTLTITRLSYRIFKVKPGYLEYIKSL